VKRYANYELSIVTAYLIFISPVSGPGNKWYVVR